MKPTEMLRRLASKNLLIDPRGDSPTKLRIGPGQFVRIDVGEITRNRRTELGEAFRGTQFDVTTPMGALFFVGRIDEASGADAWGCLQLFRSVYDGKLIYDSERKSLQFESREGVDRPIWHAIEKLLKVAKGYVGENLVEVYRRGEVEIAQPCPSSN